MKRNLTGFGCWVLGVGMGARIQRFLFALFLATTQNLTPTTLLYAARELEDPLAMTVNKDFAEANALFSKGDYPGAMDKLTAVLIKEPGNDIAREQIYQIAQLMRVNSGAMGQMSRPLSIDERADAVDLAYKSLRKTSPRLI